MVDENKPVHDVGAGPEPSISDCAVKLFFFSIENPRAYSASSDISKNPQLKLIAKLLNCWF